ncbi:hypothetical protein EDEG_00080 [Edhazardia aedis USNM 41457]|uniref:Uncharacterized protein n=1 Tax=Edhazardia aedis (strain USNM 41457) TaxID=1003232 RepID=J8ZZ48_EDHAE|nr:hypothetical protein EDEG_00080 [Edhazardia aedis USNM 41457]|eukprot:EJW04963.1 hypothetical protein EDEG_00080 [Edhazardia aedis USNM 41457]
MKITMIKLLKTRNIIFLLELKKKLKWTSMLNQHLLNLHHHAKKIKLRDLIKNQKNKNLLQNTLSNNIKTQKKSHLELIQLTETELKSIHSKNKYKRLFLELQQIYNYIAKEKYEILTEIQHNTMKKILVDLNDISDETSVLYSEKEKGIFIPDEAAKFERIRRKAITLGLKSLMQFNLNGNHKSQKVIIFETIKYLLELELENDDLRQELEMDENSE